MSRRYCLLALLVLGRVALAAPGPGGATSADRGQRPDDLLARLQRRFAPLQQEFIAVSPDGKYVAYSKRQGTDVYVITAPTDNPGRVKASVKVGSEAASEFIPPPLRGSPGKWGLMGSVRDNAPPRIHGAQPSRILQMQWASNTRLVLFTNLNKPLAGYINQFGAFVAFNADGSHGAVLAGIRDLRGFVAFAPYDERHVIVETSEGEAALMDIYSGRVSGIRFSAWTNRKVAAAPRAAIHHVRAELGPMFPDTELALLDSDRSGNAIALLADRATDPGDLYVYRRETKRLLDFGSRQPELPATPYAVHRTDFALDDHVRVQLRLIWPKPRAKAHPGIVVIAPDDLNGLPLGYNATVMAFADMGYPVLQVGVVARGTNPANPPEFYQLFDAIRQRTNWTDAEYGKLPAEIALVGITPAATEQVYWTLLADEGAVRCGILMRPARSTFSPELPAGLKVARRDGRARYAHEALCLVDALSRESAAVARASLYCRPLDNAGTYVDYLPEGYGAVVSQTKEDLAQVYVKIDGFLAGALRQARVEVGNDRVVEFGDGKPRPGGASMPPPAVKSEAPTAAQLPTAVTLPGK